MQARVSADQGQQKKVLEQALNEATNDGAISAKTANELFALAAPTKAVRQYVQWALDTHGELTQAHMMNIAALTNPIIVQSNPKLQKVFNAIREKGEINDADAKAMFEAIGKLSTEEHSKFIDLMTTLAGTPGLSDARFHEVMDMEQPLLDTRAQDTKKFHKRIQMKTWATVILSVAAAIGAYFFIGAPVNEAVTAATNMEFAGGLAQVGSILGSAFAAGTVSRKVLKPEKDFKDLETYGVND